MDQFGDEFGYPLDSSPKLPYQIIFAKFNLKVHYPPPYEREVWHFMKANTGHIKRVINVFPWKRSFANLDINDKVYIINKTIKDILSNFIPHETITFDDSDPNISHGHDMLSIRMLKLW